MRSVSDGGVSPTDPLLLKARLTIADRTTILAALEDPPADLSELRGVLLRELAWLRSEGLA